MITPPTTFYSDPNTSNLPNLTGSYRGSVSRFVQLGATLPSLANTLSVIQSHLDASQERSNFVKRFSLATPMNKRSLSLSKSLDNVLSASGQPSDLQSQSENKNSDSSQLETKARPKSALFRWEINLPENEENPLRRAQHKRSLIKKSVSFHHEIVSAVAEKHNSYDGLFGCIRRARSLKNSVQPSKSRHVFFQLFERDWFSKVQDNFSHSQLKQLYSSYGPLVLTSALAYLGIDTHHILYIDFPPRLLEQIVRACPEAAKRLSRQIYWQMQMDLREALVLCKNVDTKKAPFKRLVIPSTKITHFLALLNIKTERDAQAAFSKSEIKTILLVAKRVSKDRRLSRQLQILSHPAGVEILYLAYAILHLHSEVALPHCLIRPGSQPPHVLTNKEQHAILKNYSLRSLYQL